MRSRELFGLMQQIGPHPALLAALDRNWLQWCDQVGLHKQEEPETPKVADSSTTNTGVGGFSGCSV